MGHTAYNRYTPVQVYASTCALLDDNWIVGYRPVNMSVFAARLLVPCPSATACQIPDSAFLGRRSTTASVLPAHVSLDRQSIYS